MTPTNPYEPAWVNEVLGFWFGHLSPEDWYQRREETDEVVRQRFCSLYKELSASPPSIEGVSARTILAAVIVLDQFPRNMFRESPKAFASDTMALALADAAVSRGLDRGLSAKERHCLYLPFQHSENGEMQARSCALYSELGDAEGIDYARHHKEIIDRFGRFPHRNALLGRASTVEEETFLKEPGSSF